MGNSRGRVASPGASLLPGLLLAACAACGGREGSSGSAEAGIALDGPDESAVGAGSVVIVNSGSTNAPGFSIVVTRDANATWHAGATSPTRSQPSALDCIAVDGTTLEPTLTLTLFDDLAAAGPLGSLSFDGCLKSVSFGTTTSLSYDGATVPDVECGSSNDAHAANLTRDVNAMEKAITAVCR